MSYTAHLDLLTVPVYSPLHRRAWLITPRQYRLMVAVFDGVTGTQRELAERLGYSLSGLHDAIESLVSGGLLIKRVTRGRLGRTFLKVKAKVHVLQNLLTGNVRYLGTTYSREEEDVVSPFSSKGQSLIANISPGARWRAAA